MIQQETICGECDRHFIVVTLEEMFISNCPFCAAPIEEDEYEIEEDVSEDDS